MSYFTYGIAVAVFLVIAIILFRIILIKRARRNLPPPPILPVTSNPNSGIWATFNNAGSRMGAGGGGLDARDWYRGAQNRTAVNRVEGAEANDTELPAYGSESTTTLHLPAQPTATYNPAHPPLGSHPNAASTASLPVYGDAPPKYA